MKRIPNGTKVWIKDNVDSWAAGEWGIIRDYNSEDKEYYIAIADDKDMELVFYRNEFKVAK